MTSSIDLATALDHVLGDPNTEAKFQALKTLHAKKIKSLMSSIDTKERELDRMKALGKDNRRTEIIQSLKKKLKHHELVIHVLKEDKIQDMLKKECEESDISPSGEEAKALLSPISQEVNCFIIGKTISGPKRFRPLIREELENQIAELEKKLELERKLRSKLTVAAAAGPGGGGSGTGGTKATSKSSKNNGTSSSNGTGGKTGGSVNGSGGGNADGQKSMAEDNLQQIIGVSELQDQIVSLNQEISNRDDIIRKQKEEMCRIRSSNSSMHSLEEEVDSLDKSYKELTILHQRAVEDLEDSAHQLALAQEEKFQIQANAEQEVEQANIEIDTLRDQCEQGLKQNAQLLRLMSNLETKMMNAGSTSSKSAGTRHISPSKNPSAVSESEHSRVVEKLRNANLRVQELERGIASSDAALLALKETLRDKNEVIRDLKRDIAEISRHNAVVNGDGGTSRTSQGKSTSTALPLSSVAESKLGDSGGRSRETTPRESKGSKSSSPRI
mmetsp:Transcript_15248/g.25338  ORF Transcript_15248/g.25338 Transcript_15248/m.25338 type:complete len:501 (+) Transcript_15248:125-1627(+)